MGYFSHDYSLYKVLQIITDCYVKFQLIYHINYIALRFNDISSQPAITILIQELTPFLELVAAHRMIPHKTIHFPIIWFMMIVRSCCLIAYKKYKYIHF